VHRVRPEIEKTNHGTFLPTYARLWSVDGKSWSKERALMPGYLFFLTEPEGWGDVSNVDGVYAVLSNDSKASRVTDDEMRRMVLDHAMGVHNRIEGKLAAEPAKPRYGRRRRRPRHGKRMRAAA
jgi:transcription antitermination factor NusG